MAIQEGTNEGENKVEKYDTKDIRFINDWLKAEGEKGFELVHVVGDLYYFKRKKAE